MASAALAYKCMEVAYLKVVYSCNSTASRDRLELLPASKLNPPGIENDILILIVDCFCVLDYARFSLCCMCV